MHKKPYQKDFQVVADRKSSATKTHLSATNQGYLLLNSTFYNIIVGIIAEHTSQKTNTITLSDDRCITTKHLHSSLAAINEIPSKAEDDRFRLRLY